MRKSKANKCKCCNSALVAVTSHLIFDEVGKQQNIAFLLFDYIGKKVIESDGDQQAVCDNCLKQLIQCYEFKQKCVQANENDSEDDENEFEDYDYDGTDTKSIIEEISEDEAENFTGNIEETTTDSACDFDRYVEVIEEYDGVGNEDEDVDDTNVSTKIEQTATENEFEFLNNLSEFVLTKVYDATDEQRSPIPADIEYLDVDEMEDEIDYAEIEDSFDNESEVIELSEFVLDTTSKTVKTIGKFTFNFNFIFSM